MTSLAIFKSAPFTEAAVRELRHNEKFRAGFQLRGCGWWLGTEEGQEKDKNGLPQKQAGSLQVVRLVWPRL